MAKPPISLLLVSPLPPPPGGIATWTRILLNELAQCQQIDVSHINTALRWRPIVSQLILLRVVVGTCQAVWDGLRVILKFILWRPTVMHLTTSGRLGLAKDLTLLNIARLFGVLSVLHIHDPRVGQIKDTQEWQLRLTLFAIGFADRVIVLDQKSYDVLSANLPKRQVHRVPNMISLAKIDEIISQENDGLRPIEEKDFRIAFVGRVIRQKGIEELVEACTDLEGVSLHCLGPIDENCRQRIEHSAQRRQKGGWLKLYGHVSREDVLRHVHRSDLFVLPSHSEAFPLSILESMALSRPVVATSVGAVHEIVQPDSAESCGLCVEAEDVEALRGAISQMMSDPQTRADLGSHGRQRVERLYSTIQVIKLLKALWVR